MRKLSRLWLIFALALSVLTACGQPETHAVRVAPTPQLAPSVTATIASAVYTAVPVTTVMSHYQVVKSLKERVTTASLIVVGQISGAGAVINGARDIEDINKPAANLYGVMQIYHLQVQRYLKGSGPPAIDIVQVEGMIDGDPAVVKQADIEQAKAAYDYIPFQAGTTYLLFLDRQDYLHLDQDYYGPAFGHPWRFVIASDGKAQPEAPEGALREMRPDFMSSSATPLLPQVEQLIKAEQPTQAP